MKHSKIKQTIIDTATRLFYSNGYNRTGINEIIKEAGIAKATLYSHFPSKEDICIAYLQNKSSVFERDIEEFCLSKPKGEERILAIFDFLQAFFQDKDFNGCWCIKTVAEIPKDNQRIQEEIRAQKNTLIKFISGLALDNLHGMDEETSKVLGRRIYLLYESAVAESHLHQADWPIAEMKKVSSQLIS
ncbi:MAG: TetR/AcrR family transcriptional regulator [Bacteroidota bacterium]